MTSKLAKLWKQASALATQASLVALGERDRSAMCNLDRDVRMVQKTLGSLVDSKGCIDDGDNDLREIAELAIAITIDYDHDAPLSRIERGREKIRNLCRLAHERRQRNGITTTQTEEE